MGSGKRDGPNFVYLMRSYPQSPDPRQPSLFQSKQEIARKASLQNPHGDTKKGTRQWLFCKSLRCVAGLIFAAAARSVVLVTFWPDRNEHFSHSMRDCGLAALPLENPRQH